jgi:CubicO group peptidase (beta-lactamase class C family)
MNQRPDRRNFLKLGAAAGAGTLLGLPALSAAADDWPAVQALLDRYVAAGTLPGVAASVARGTGPARFFAAGTLERGGRERVDADSLFRIMSMTKPVTGMAVMMLIEDGRMKLDQELADFIPAFASARVLIDPAKGMDSRPASRRITIRHLLTHTSGLGYFSRAAALRDAYLKLGLVPVRTGRGALVDTPSFDYAPSLDAFAERTATLPLLVDPGTSWIYSMSPDLLGRVIEIASGMPFDAFLAQRIFAPLGMTSTYFTVPKSEAGRLTSLYEINDKGTLVDGRADSILFEPPPFLWGGAGLITSPRDYDRFLLMLAGEGAIGNVRILRRETARLGMSNLLPPGVSVTGNGGGFGALGSVALTPVPDGRGVGTYGWSGGAGTTAFVDPSKGVRAAGYGQYVQADALPLRAEFTASVYARG